MRYFKKNYTTPIKHVSKFTNSALLRKINIIRYYKRPSGVVNSNHSSLSINVLKLLYKTLFFFIITQTFSKFIFVWHESPFHCHKTTKQIYEAIVDSQLFTNLRWFGSDKDKRSKFMHFTIIPVHKRRKIV